MPQPLRIIIEGQTNEGKTFRPSDWSERLSDLLAQFGRDHRIQYSPLLRPVIRNGVRSVAMDDRIQSHHPAVFQQIMQFAEANKLKVVYEGAGPALHANAA